MDLVGPDALRDEPAFDGLGDGDDGRHALRRVAEPAERVDREADAAVEDEHRDLREEARHHCQGPRLALLRMDDLDPVPAEDAHERRH